MLLTGATGGLGEAIARELGGRGAKLIASGLKRNSAQGPAIQLLGGLQYARTPFGSVVVGPVRSLHLLQADHLGHIFEARNPRKDTESDVRVRTVHLQFLARGLVGDISAFKGFGR